VQEACAIFLTILDAKMLIDACVEASIRALRTPRSDAFHRIRSALAISDTLCGARGSIARDSFHHSIDAFVDASARLKKVVVFLRRSERTYMHVRRSQRCRSSQGRASIEHRMQHREARDRRIEVAYHADAPAAGIAAPVPYRDGATLEKNFVGHNKNRAKFTLEGLRTGKETRIGGSGA
jgi:hypothetical protein